MSKQRLIKAVAIALIATALIFLYLRFVEATGFMPRCLIKWGTGYDCPGCGSQRALLALVHGHPLQALQYNLILIPALAYLALLLAAWLCPNSTRLKRISEIATSPLVLVGIAIVILAWAIVRNVLGI